eukprot:2628372-Pyramimonas_sp.AAC.1
MGRIAGDPRGGAEPTMTMSWPAIAGAVGPSAAPRWPRRARRSDRSPRWRRRPPARQRQRRARARQWGHGN